MGGRRREAVAAIRTDEGGSPRGVMLEVRGVHENSLDAMQSFIERLNIVGCSLDRGFEPVSMEASDTQIIRCHVRSEKVVDQLRKHPDVVAVWEDAEIAPFGDIDSKYDSGDVH